ncbi:GTP cyclohydrolase I [uncultured Megasphaera sp.]|uniref:GTP cyclohydrolase I n=1 Tax=uncultured Megasphaera sp. TaxID=165188 RepID=UPI002659F229|nr:GTP cyclohydrolase I [uncultured Megasphaera sp.]
MTETTPPSQPVNERAAAAMKQFLEALGLDLQQLGMEKTPYRVAEAFARFFSGLRQSPDDEWSRTIHTESNGLVLVRNIRFYSMCEHHLLPFFGVVHIAYKPKDGQIAGFGHFVNAVRILARRPQLQERMTEDLCQSISRGLQADGVLVLVKATHLCMSMCDELAADTNIVTVSSAGCLRSGTAAYEDAWRMVTAEEETH